MAVCPGELFLPSADLVTPLDDRFWWIAPFTSLHRFSIQESNTTFESCRTRIVKLFASQETDWGLIFPRSTLTAASWTFLTYTFWLFFDVRTSDEDDEPKCPFLQLQFNISTAPAIVCCTPMASPQARQVFGISCLISLAVTRPLKAFENSSSLFIQAYENLWMSRVFSCLARILSWFAVIPASGLRRVKAASSGPSASSPYKLEK